MQRFTSAWASLKQGGKPEIDWESTKQIIETELLPAISKALGSEIGALSVFGADSPHDIASDAVRWLLERLTAPSDLPEKIIDTQSLIYYLCDWACDRRSKQRRRLAGDPTKGGARRGESALGKGPDQEPRTLDSLSPDGVQLHRPISPEEMTEEISEALHAAMEDFTAWTGSDSRSMKVFLSRMQTGATGEMLAEQFHISPPTITRDLQRAQFCLMRRLGYEQPELARKFSEADRWANELEELTKKPPLGQKGTKS